MITSTVTSKGQVTIPLQVRKKLGINKGMVLVFNADDNHFTATLKPTISTFYGKFDGLSDGKDAAAEIREWRSRK